jgi:hypothetical protein
MNPDFIDALIIGFVAAVLFLLVDKYEREGLWLGYSNFCCCSLLAWGSCTNCSRCSALSCFSA